MSRIQLENLTNTLNLIVSWIFGIFFLFCSFCSTTIDYNYFSGVVFFLAAVIMTPPTVDELKKRLNISMSGGMRFFLVLILVVSGFEAIPSNNTTVNNSTNTLDAIPSSAIDNGPIDLPSEPTLVVKPTLTPTEQTKPYSASINLHGEKTNFVKGEDILFKLSAVNLITKPTMHVQVIIIPPSGMSVSSSEFVESGAGQYTAVYNLEPGKGKDIEVRIVANQIGNFNVNGRVVYYFGNEKKDAEDYTFSLPIQVREAPNS